MRSHGVPGFPDPASNGGAPEDQRAVARGQRLPVPGGAERLPARLLPAATSFQQQAKQCLQAGDCPQALVQQMLTADRSFARVHALPRRARLARPQPSMPRDGRSSTSSRPASRTARRIRRRSRTSWLNASVWIPAPAAAGVELKGTAVAALRPGLAAACGGSPSSTGAVVSAQTVNSQAVAFSGCMRSHGVPDFPDPDQPGRRAQGHPAASRGQRCPLPGGPARLRAAAPAVPGPGTADHDRPAELRPLHARPRHTELARPHAPIAVVSPFSTFPASTRIRRGSATRPTHARTCWSSPPTGPTTIQLCDGIGEGGGCAGYGDPRGGLGERAGRPWASWPCCDGMFPGRLLRGPGRRRHRRRRRR